jgi:hypothetical protein
VPTYHCPKQIGLDDKRRYVNDATNGSKGNELIGSSFTDWLPLPLSILTIEETSSSDPLGLLGQYWCFLNCLCVLYAEKKS